MPYTGGKHGTRYRLAATPLEGLVLDSAAKVSSTAQDLDALKTEAVHESARVASRYLVQVVPVDGAADAEVPHVTLAADRTDRCTIDAAGVVTATGTGPVVITGTPLASADGDAGSCTITLPLEILADVDGATETTWAPDPTVAAKHLLCIYGPGSGGAAGVVYQYTAGRPGAAQGNQLELATLPVDGGGLPLEEITEAQYVEHVRTPVVDWLLANPTKPIRYIVLLWKMPTRITGGDGASVCWRLSRCLQETGHRQGMPYAGAADAFCAAKYRGVTALVTHFTQDQTAADEIAPIGTIRDTRAAGLVNAATYLGRDTTTQGDWRGTYGTLGWQFFGVEGTHADYSLPVDPLTFANRTALVWSATVGAGITRALQKPATISATDRVAAASVQASGQSWSFEWDGSDTFHGVPRTLSIYFLDYDAPGGTRDITLDVTPDGEALQSYRVSGDEYYNGVYLRFACSGKVTFSVRTDQVGGTAAASAVFLEQDGDYLPVSGQAAGIDVSNAHVDAFDGAYPYDLAGLAAAAIADGDGTLVQHTDAHPTALAGTAMLMTWGANGGRGGDWPDATELEPGAWWVLVPLEHDGGRRAGRTSNYASWRGADAWGGASVPRRDPVGAIAYAGNPYLAGYNGPEIAALWLAGRPWAECAYATCRSRKMIVFGDPLVMR